MGSQDGITLAAVPFLFPNANTCNKHNLKCPLKEDVEHKLKKAIVVKKIYPSLSLETWLKIHTNVCNFVTTSLACVCPSRAPVFSCAHYFQGSPSACYEATASPK